MSDINQYAEFIQELGIMRDIGLTRLYVNIQSLILSDDLVLLDMFLNSVKPCDYHPEVHVALLRYTYSVKNYLPSWPLLLKKVEEQLLIEGLDAKSMLQGFYD